MSWAEVAKMQETQRDRAYNNSYVFESSGTFTAPHTGYYKIIVVGMGGYGHVTVGGNNSVCASGGGGGVAIKTKKMEKGATLAMNISSSASCDGMTATGGGNGSSTRAGSGGTATGGDYNYTGLDGNMTKPSATGGSIGCVLPSLMSRDTLSFSSSSSTASYTTTAVSGWGIYGHGGGAGASTYGYASGTTQSQPACVMIIPLESL